MSDIKVGSPVKLKGGNQLMTITLLRQINCDVTWTIDGGGINTFTYLLDALEVVPDSEVKEERKRFNKRENAKVGLSLGDQINKIGSPVVAVLSIVAVVFQTYRLKNLEDKIDSLTKSIELQIPQSKIEEIPKKLEQ